MLPGLAPLLPDSGVRVSPATADKVGQRSDHPPAGSVEFRPETCEVPASIDHPSVNVELVLLCCCIRRTHRNASSIPGDAFDLSLSMPGGAIHRVEHVHSWKRQPAGD